MPRSSLIPVPAGTPVPSLRKGNDAEVAQELRRLIADAQDGLIRIARLGAFIDHIREELPHGALNGWIAAHCSQVSVRTVFRWRKICAGLLHDAGITGQKLRSMERPLHDVLALPLESLSENEAEVVEAIRDAAENTTHKSLEKRSTKPAKTLSPAERFDANAKSQHELWVGLIGDIDLALNNSSLSDALHHDPSLANRIEEVRLRLGRQLADCVKSHKKGTAKRHD